MFLLYKDYLKCTQNLAKNNLKQLAQKAESIVGLKNSGITINTAFMSLPTSTCKLLGLLSGLKSLPV